MFHSKRVIWPLHNTHVKYRQQFRCLCVVFRRCAKCRQWWNLDFTAAARLPTVGYCASILFSLFNREINILASSWNCLRNNLGDIVYFIFQWSQFQSLILIVNYYTKKWGQGSKEAGVKLYWLPVQWHKVQVCFSYFQVDAHWNLTFPLSLLIPYPPSRVFKLVSSSNLIKLLRFYFQAPFFPCSCPNCLEVGTPLLTQSVHAVHLTLFDSTLNHAFSRHLSILRQPQTPLAPIHLCN